jgi:signal transduction histidine kinase/CheY-like chemotaxis protein
MKRPGEDRPAIYVLTALLVTGVFGLDLVTNLGTEEWVLYFIPLTVSLFASRPLAPVAIGVVCAGLVGAGYFLSADPAHASVVPLTQINRALGSAALIGLGFVGWRFVAARTRLELEDWIKDGQVQLSARMRGERDLDDLGRGILSGLAEYTGARIGIIYVVEESGTLARTAGYGVDKLDAAAKTIAPGETLVGQVAVDGRLLVVDDVPDGYMMIRSGTGAAKPRTLVLAPTDADGVVNGVVELGYFTPPVDATRALLESVSASIGIAIRSARYRRRQAELLEETQRQAEELQIQHEELKAANEELEDQGRALHESHTELEERNRQLVEQARVLELQKEHLSSAQDILRGQTAAVERASRYKSDFLANMSHELRTPLNSTLILSKLLVDNKQGNLTSEQVQYAANIYTAGNDLLALINDILDLSKIEAGKLDLTFEQVELARVFAAVAQRFQPLANDKKIELAFAIEPGCPARIETDARRFQQIITNLVSNAVKFTERGSVRLRGAGLDDQLIVSVEDTGIGIPATQHQAIFEAFRQADGMMHGGTGLGLSICRELANLLGGEIELTSAPGAGSTFTVVLPRRPGKTARVRGTRPGTNSDKSAPVRAATPTADDDRAALTDQARVLLVVEDDRALATILRELAHEFRFQCVIARTAAEGLELVHEFKPIAIILDLCLPDHSGLAVVDRLKRDASARHIPIYVIAGHDYEQVVREMGIVDHELSRKTRTVLVVEDDETQREAIVRLLASEDIAVTAARTAEEAWAQLDAEPLDCVILDLMLPGASGFELLDRMTKSGKPRLPPVIVYTARALTLDEEQRLRRHATSIIIKGARSPERLLEEVTLFLHQPDANLPEDKRRMLRRALDREAVFTGRRILIVEDDVRSIFALTSALEPRGAAIEVARNGKEALRRLEADPRVDIVLMDVMMPEMDGLTATQEIRKQHAPSRLPIIALTAKAMPDDRERCFEAGANDYIAKPVDVDKLISLCRVWMPR